MNNFNIIMETKKKKNKTEVDLLLLKCKSVLSYIGETLVEESKYQINPQQALVQIRRYLQDNM